MKSYRTHIMLCAGTGCVSNGTYKIKDALERELERHDLQDEIDVVMTGCNGFCAQGPVMTVQPEDLRCRRNRATDAWLAATIASEMVPLLSLKDLAAWLREQASRSNAGHGTADWTGGPGKAGDLAR